MKKILSVCIVLTTAFALCGGSALAQNLSVPFKEPLGEQGRGTTGPAPQQAHEPLHSSQAPSRKPSIPRRSKPGAERSILGQLRALRIDVTAVRRDVRRLVELLEARSGPANRPEENDSSGVIPDSAGYDVPGASWGMTQQLAFVNAFQNSGEFMVKTAGNPTTICRATPDITIADAKHKAASLVYDVERGYWDLWLAYRRLDMTKEARDVALETWRAVSRDSDDAPDAAAEHDARARYFSLRDNVEQCSRTLFASEQTLRFVLGLPGEDGRLIRPIDAPSLTEAKFDWNEISTEAIGNRLELARQRRKLKQLEEELVATKVGSAGHRNTSLRLSRERAEMQEQELNVVHQLSDAMRALHKAYGTARTSFHRRVAVEQEMDALTETHPDGILPDVLRDARQRHYTAEVDYSKSLVDFAAALGNVHFLKGSSLRYRSIVVEDSAATAAEPEDSGQI